MTLAFSEDELAGDGFGESRPVHDVREHFVCARRTIREPLFERSAASIFRMEVPEAIERRRHDKQMHQMTVIGDEVVGPTQANHPGSRSAKVRRPSGLTAVWTSSGLYT